MQAPLSEPVLSLRRLTKSYGALVAVDGLSLDVLRGEVVGLLGPNGAGKTTTIHMICGLLKPDAGSVLLNGRSLADTVRQCRREIGLCPQTVVVWESLTCFEQLELVGRLYDVRPALSRKRATDLLGALGLEDKTHKLARTLSAGMKRRLNLALALVHDPQVFILDEPQAELDPHSRILVREYIRSLAHEKTVLLSTHDMDEADRLADRIAIIDHGRLLVVDSPEALKKQAGAGDILEISVQDGQEEKLDRLLQTLPDRLSRLSYQQGLLRLVGADTTDVLPLLLDRLRSFDLEVRDIVIRRTTLEDVFVALTGRRLRE